MALAARHQAVRRCGGAKRRAEHDRPDGLRSTQPTALPMIRSLRHPALSHHAADSAECREVPIRHLSGRGRARSDGSTPPLVSREPIMKFVARNSDQQSTKSMIDRVEADSSAVRPGPTSSRVTGTGGSEEGPAKRSECSGHEERDGSLLEAVPLCYAWTFSASRDAKCACRNGGRTSEVRCGPGRYGGSYA
jgi:hypothetical protein